jgi:hypothetical protein
MDCEICHQPYNSDERMPMTLLPCSHTFCDDCLKKVDQKACHKCKKEWDSIVLNESFSKALEEIKTQIEMNTISLAKAFGLENDEQTQQLIKFIQTAKSIKNLSLLDTFRKMPNLMSEMARNLNDLGKTVRKEFKDVREVESVIVNLINGFNEEVKKLSSEFAIIENELQETKKDILTVCQSSNDIVKVFTLPSIRARSKRHNEKINYLRVKSEIQHNKLKEDIAHCLDQHDNIKDVAQKRVEFNSKLGRILPNIGFTSGCLVGGGVVSCVVASEILGGVGSLVIAGFVFSPIGAIALGSLVAGVGIGGLVYLVMYILKCKNEAILKKLESYYSNLTCLSESSDAFYGAADEIYSKLEYDDTVEQIGNNNDKLKDIGEVIVLIDSFLETIREFKVRLGEGDFRVEASEKKQLAITN